MRVLWEDEVSEDEVSEKHYWVGHLLTPFTLAVRPECLTWSES